MALAILAVALCASAQQQGPRVLAPISDAAVLVGDLDVIGVGVTDEPLLVDGKAHTWEHRTARGAFTRVDLASGEHEITLGESVVTVTATDELPEDDARLLRAHGRDEGDGACVTCHPLPAEGGDLESADTPAACLGCHTTAEFEVTHFHPLDPIRACEMCHAVHGATERALLRAPIKGLCAKCHE